jgi:hypothetical protein
MEKGVLKDLMGFAQNALKRLGNSIKLCENDSEKRQLKKGKNNYKITEYIAKNLSIPLNKRKTPMQRTHKIRLNPTLQQTEYLHKACGTIGAYLSGNASAMKAVNRQPIFSLNAARNIEREALNIFSRRSGFTETLNGRGQDIRPFWAVLEKTSKLAEERQPSISAVV